MRVGDQAKRAAPHRPPIVLSLRRHGCKGRRARRRRRRCRPCSDCGIGWRRTSFASWRSSLLAPTCPTTHRRCRSFSHRADADAESQPEAVWSGGWASTSQQESGQRSTPSSASEHVGGGRPSAIARLPCSPHCTEHNSRCSGTPSGTPQQMQAARKERQRVRRRGWRRGRGRPK
jgi:hypothetical protein